ncbi:hypothetical protein BDZ91DRAFT_392013 [Kalaharituber pfeilii]|nr:hypothetical protein BDZ91DRAFT_392013 [Kalaharituber pfeilii]
MGKLLCLIIHRKRKCPVGFLAVIFARSLAIEFLPHQRPLRAQPLTSRHTDFNSNIPKLTTAIATGVVPTAMTTTTDLGWYVM